MSISKTTAELLSHKTAALNKLEKYLDTLIASTDEQSHGKADKISYWLEDYTKFLEFETKFDAKKFPEFKKGQIVKVHLGFNIGSEEGGLHYATVIENNNPRKSPVLNVVPLTSVKSTTDITKIRSDLGQVYLGDELYRLLCAKISSLKTTIADEVKNLKAIIISLAPGDPQISVVKGRIDKLEKTFDTLQKAKNEVSKMKIGSIALVGQITTISKIRIYDPKNTSGVLNGIRLSNLTLDKIDNAICNLYIKSK